MASFSQHISSPPILLKEKYLTKSNKQRKAALAFACVGGAFGIAGIISGLSHFDLLDHKTNSVSEIFLGIGTVCLTVAIPFQIVSKKNYRKAASMSN